MSWHPTWLPRVSAQWLNEDTLSVDELPYRNQMRDYKRLKVIGDEIRYRNDLSRKGLGSNYLTFALNTPRNSAHSQTSAAEKGFQKLKKDIPKGPINFNQAFLGDPLPGRSALDKLNASKGEDDGKSNKVTIKVTG